MGSTGHENQPGVPPSLAALDVNRLLDRLADAVVVADRSGRVLFLNDAAERLLGWGREEIGGWPITDLLPVRMRCEYGERLARFRSRPGPGRLERPVRLPALRRDGSEVEVELLATRFSDPSGGLIVLSLRDLTDRVELEHQLNVTRYLRATAEVAVKLGLAGGAAALEDAATDVLRAVGGHLGWAAGVLWEIDPAGPCLRPLETWEAESGSTELAELAAAIDGHRVETGDGVAGRAWADGRPSWTTELGDDRVDAAARAAGLTASLAFPILVRDEVTGVVQFFHTDDAPPHAELLEAMITVGRQVGQFVEAERADETMQIRLAFLARATAVLEASLDYDVTLANLARLAVPFLGDTCVVDVLQADGVEQVAVATADPAKAGVIRELRDSYPPNPDRPSPAMRAFASGKPIVRRGLTPEHWRARARDDRHARLLDDLGLRSTMSVPLTARGRALGVLTLGITSDRDEFGDDDLALAVDLARRASMAVDNARLFTERSYAARKLQESLLPGSLPEVPSVGLAVRYLAAGAGAEVGGDFYDVFSIGDGGWGLVVGDVTGKGVEAAATTGLVRHTLRALALRERVPSRVLADVNTVLVRDGEPDRLCTVCYATAVPGQGFVDLTLTLAGHPMPIVLRADGSTELVGEPGGLLGAFDDVGASDVAVHLDAGDSIVLYTDGVIERRGVGGQFFGQRRLRDLLGRLHHRSADEIADAVQRAVAGFQGDATRDDLAVLVARVTPT